jgi:hypothetical protein
MPHFLLTSALLFALLAIIGIAVGACMSIARDLMLDGTEDDGEEQSATTDGNGGMSLSEDFGVGAGGRQVHR